MCAAASTGKTNWSASDQSIVNTYLTGMTLSRAHTSVKAADVAKLLLLNKRRVTQSLHAEYSITPT